MASGSETDALNLTPSIRRTAFARTPPAGLQTYVDTRLRRGGIPGPGHRRWRKVENEGELSGGFGSIAPHCLVTASIQRFNNVISELCQTHRYM